MTRLIRFFIRGPGAILVVIIIALGIAGIIKHGQDKERAEADKRQTQRELGKVNPQTDVDKSKASKEVILSDRRLNPGNKTAQPEPAPAYSTQLSTAQQRTALPTLVSFYTQIAPTPSTTPVVGEVIRDVYQNGHLIIPAGAICTCFAQAGAVRDRIEVAGKWSLVYPDGK